MRKMIAAVPLAALLGLTFVATSPTIASTSACPNPDGGVYDATDVDGESVKTCDLAGVLVTNDEATVRMPAPGLGISLTDLRLDGTESGLSIVVSSEGVVDVVDQAAKPSPRKRAANGPCDDTSYHLNSQKWDAAMEWNVNRQTIPSGDIDPDLAIAALRDAVQNITGANNSCNMPDDVSAAASYQGTSTDTAAIGIDEFGNGTCGYGNSRNTVFFGTRPPYVGASTCVQTVDRAGYDRIKEMDIEIDKSHTAWTTAPNASGCSVDYDLESLITHEFGHGYGLGHVGDPGGRLTMLGTALGPCNLEWRTLGRGDVLGLRVYYQQ